MKKGVSIQKIVRVTREIGYNAEKTSMDWPVARSVTAAIQQTTSNPVLQVPTLGGSLPLQDLVETLDTKFLIIPIANYDNNQHASDENIKLENFWEGIDMIASVMMMKF